MDGDTDPQAKDSQTVPSSRNHNPATVQFDTAKGTPKGGPRSAGFSPRSATLTEWLEFSNDRNFRTLYEALRGDPPASNEYYAKPLYEAFRQHSTNSLRNDLKSGGRKHFFDALFRARTKRNSTTVTEIKKTLQINHEAGLALQRTSDGHTYGHIFPTTDKIYEGGASNGSTYRINARKQSREMLVDHGAEKPAVPAKDVNDGIKSSDQATIATEKSQELVDGSPNHQSNEQRVLSHNISRHQSHESEQSPTNNPGKRFGVHRSRKEKVHPKQGHCEISTQILEAAPAIPSPVHRTNESMLGLSREFSQILSGDKVSEQSAGIEPGSIANAKNQPIIRDFAIHRSSFVKAARALRARSRSPAKRASKQQGQHQQSPRKTPNFSKAPALKPTTLNIEAALAQKADPGPAEAVKCWHASPAAPPTTPDSVIRIPARELRPSPIADTFSKPASVVSTESITEDIVSDASSAIVFNAHSAVIMRPPMPGPAPTTPLPSLPEGHDAPIPVTPRSSREIACQGYSPTRFSPTSPGRVLPKSPARYRYTPTGQGWSPPKPKRPASPIRRNAITEIEHIATPSSSPTKRHTTSYSRPHQDLLPKSITARSTSAGDTDQVQLRMVESINFKEARDFQPARMKSQKADFKDAMPGASSALHEEALHHGIVELPTIRDSYDSSTISGRHMAQPSQISDLSLSIAAQRQRESVILSHRLSPIILVAEQAPTPLIQRAPSQTTSQNRDSVDEYLQSHYPESHTSLTSIDERPQRPTTNGFLPKPAKPASPSLHPPEEESRVRPSSIHSMPLSRPVSLSARSIPTSRPVAARVPAPFAEPLLRADAPCSSRHSSIHTADDLKARLAAIEKKNVMLESALMAIIDCSSRYGSGSGGMSSRERGGPSVLSNDGREGDRSSGVSGLASLYAESEKVLNSQARTTNARFSTASGP